MLMVSLCGSVGVVAHARVRKVRVPLSKHPVAHRRMREGCWEVAFFYFLSFATGASFLWYWHRVVVDTYATDRVFCGVSKPQLAVSLLYESFSIKSRENFTSNIKKRQTCMHIM